MTQVATHGLLLREALRYAAEGRFVFPLHSPYQGGCSCRIPTCESVAKHPRTARGLLDASRDEAVIRKWWATWTEPNVAIATGSRSGVVVLDVDDRHDGSDSLRLLEEQVGPLLTAEVITGGGRHLYFRHDGAVRNAVGLAGLPGLDVPGDGGYVVAPPSLHASGRHYQWDLAERPMAPLPPELARLFGSPRPHASAAVGSVIIAGRRNSDLASLAGSMRRRGMTEDEIGAALLVVNARCNPPLAEAEVRNIARNIGRYAPAPMTRPEPRGGIAI